METEARQLALVEYIHNVAGERLPKPPRWGKGTPLARVAGWHLEQVARLMGSMVTLTWDEGSPQLAVTEIMAEEENFSMMPVRWVTRVMHRDPEAGSLTLYALRYLSSLYADWTLDDQDEWIAEHLEESSCADGEGQSLATYYEEGEPYLLDRAMRFMPPLRSPRHLRELAQSLARRRRNPTLKRVLAWVEAVAAEFERKPSWYAVCDVYDTEFVVNGRTIDPDDGFDWYPVTYADYTRLVWDTNDAVYEYIRGELDSNAAEGGTLPPVVRLTLEEFCSGRDRQHLWVRTLQNLLLDGIGLSVEVEEKFKPSLSQNARDNSETCKTLLSTLTTA